jgi:hypothetical protein
MAGCASIPEASPAIVFASPENRLPQQEVMTLALRPRKYCSSSQKLSHQHRQQQEQQAVFDAHQRVIAGAGVDVVDRQPHAARKKTPIWLISEGKP